MCWTVICIFLFFYRSWNMQSRQYFQSQNRINQKYLFGSTKNISMGKKVQAQTTVKTKKNQIKHKQMFNELSTHRQEIIDRQKQEKRIVKSQRIKVEYEAIIDENSQDDIEIDISRKDNHNIEDVCMAVNKLFAKNKINVKNAFDVPIINIEEIPDFEQTVENENAWKKISSTLENDYKIYAYRVDAIHSIAYSLINTISRRNEDPQNLIENNKNNLKKQKEIREQGLIIRQQNDYESANIEQNLQNINISEMDCNQRVDPILQRTKRKFDQSGFQSLLLNSLSIDNSLSLSLISNKQENNVAILMGQYVENEWKTDLPLQFFTRVQDIKSQISKKLFNNKPWAIDQQLDQNLKEQWHSNNEYNQPLEQMIDENNSIGAMKQISEFIKMKKPLKQKLSMNNNDFIADADGWMTDIDRKMLGLKGSNDGQKKLSKTQNSELFAVFEDKIDFDNEEEESDKVFLKQADKGDWDEQIEDKFLMAKRLDTNFQVQRTLTIRQQVVELTQITFEQEEDPIFDKPIDVRRQELSIRQTKDKLRNILSSKSPNFRTVLTNYNQSSEYQISPAMCFLTMLHLANQGGWQFNQRGDDDFLIKL